MTLGPPTANLRTRRAQTLTLLATLALFGPACTSPAPPVPAERLESGELGFLDRLRAEANGTLPPEKPVHPRAPLVEVVSVPDAPTPALDSSRSSRPASDAAIPGKTSPGKTSAGKTSAESAVNAIDPIPPTAPVESEARSLVDLHDEEDTAGDEPPEESATAGLEPPPAGGATGAPGSRLAPPRGQRLARLTDFRPSSSRVLAASKSAAGPMTVDLDGSLLVLGHPSRSLAQRYSAENLEPVGEPFDFTRGAFAAFDAADEVGTRQQIADILVFTDADGATWDVTVFWAYYNSQNTSYEKVHCRRRSDGLVVSAIPATEARGQMGVQVFGGGVAIVPPAFQERFGGRELVCGWSVTQQTISSSNGPSCILFSPRKLVEVRKGEKLAYDDAPLQFHPQKRAHPNWTRASSLRDRFWIDTPELRAYVIVGSVGRSGETYYKRLPDGTKVSGGYFDVDGYEGVFIITDPLELESDGIEGRPVWRLRESETWYRTGELLPETVDKAPAGLHATIAGCAHDAERRIVYLLRPWADESGSPRILQLRY